MGMFADRARKKEEELNKALGKPMAYHSTSSLDNVNAANSIANKNATAPVINANTLPSVAPVSRLSSAIDRANQSYANSLPTASGVNRTNNVIKGVASSTAASFPLLAETTKQSISDWQNKVKAQGLRSAMDDYTYNLDNPSYTFGKPIDKDSKAYQNYAKSQAYYAKALEGLTPAQQKAGQLGISMLESASTLPTAFINPSAPLVLMGAKSAAGKAYDLTNQGKTATEAAGRGYLTGAIEAATEKIPLENLIKVAKTGGKSAVKNILQQMGTEGSEELVSYIMNYAADVSANDKNAQFSPREAFENFVGGAISGGVMGGIGSAIGNYTDSRMDSYNKNAPGKADNIKVEPFGTRTFSADAAIQPVKEAHNDSNNIISSNNESYNNNSKPSLIDYPVNKNSNISLSAATSDINKVKKISNASKSDIITFVKNGMQNLNKKQYLRLGETSNRLVNDVKKIGLNISGYVHALKDNSIRHINKSHGSKSNDKYKVGINEYLLLDDIYNNYDALYQGYDTKDGNKTIAYEKKVNNKIYVVEEVFEEGVLAPKQIIVTGIDSKPSFLKKYKKISGELDTDVMRTNTHTTDYKSPPGNHVQDASSSTNIIISNSNENYNNNLNQNIPEYLGGTLPGVSNMEQQSQRNSTVGNREIPMRMENPQNMKFDNASLSVPLEQNSVNNNFTTPHEYDPSSLTTTVPLERNNQYRGNSDSKFGESVQNQNLYDDTFKNMAADNDNINTYDSTTNKKALETAQDRLSKGGAQETIRWLGIDEKSATDVDIAEGFILMKQYQDVGDYDGMITIAEKLRKLGTVSGQAVQAFSIMKRMTPEGMVRFAQQELKKAYNAMSDKASQGWIDKHVKDFDLNADDVQYIVERMKKVQGMPDGREKNILLGEVQARITNKIPPAKGDSIRALARISMLFNSKTQIRNVLGNVTVIPQAIASDSVGSIIDKLISKQTGMRTTGNYSTSSLLEIPKGMIESYQDYKLGINTKDINANKFDISPGKNFSDNNVVGKALNKIDALNSFLLDAGDRGFYNMWYENSLKNQMKLNGVSEATAEMKDIAALDALQRTWQDSNAYTKMVSNIKNTMNRVNIKGYGLGDVVMPFVKTPANLVKAVVDYSPVGVVKSLVTDANRLKSATRTGTGVAQAQKIFVSNLSKGIVGSLLMAVYGVLSDKGILTGDKDKDKDVSNFEKYIMGIQPFSINIGNGSYSYEWAQPVGGSMAVMANAVQAYKNSPGTGNLTKDTVNSILEGVKASGKTLFNLSVVYSLSQFMEQGDIVSGAIEVLTKEPSKFMPSTGRQFAQLGDKTRRRTYVHGDIVQTAINEVKSSIPEARNTLEPVVDVLGREVESNNSAFDTFFNPANYYKDRSNDIANEIYSLYNNTGDKSVIPPVAPYKISDYNLTPSEVTKYQKTTGNIISNAITDLTNSPYYGSLKPEDKAEVYKDIYTYAQDKAKNSILPEYPLSATSQKADKASRQGIPESDYFMYRYYLNSLDNGEANAEAKRNYLENNTYLSSDEKSKLDKLLISYGKDKEVDYSSHTNYVLSSQMSDAAQRKWDRFESMGLSIDDYVQVYKAATSGTKNERLANLQALGYNYSEALQLYKAATKK